MRRFFFALWPDDTIRAQLLRTALKIECGDGRRIVAANLHVTLLFIGNVEDGSVEGIGEAADSVIGDRFALHFDTLDRRRGGIAWLAPKVIPPGLSKLVEQLRRRTTDIGMPAESRPYRPHVTICRRLRRAPAPPDGGIDIRWPVDEFSLVESLVGPDGVRYEVRRRWRLATSE